ncbi:GNAT family N-acetyltransferase [Chelativorans sp.]|uniref:GNAT family N-acetyltransferase n=1 Tax=Chelativorans sp. TaxID=2203393 RepID=UPI0028116F83|nr:GNAT family N-acetyltransferase [Chelativorans sp.]
MTIEFRADPYPANGAMNDLWRQAWGATELRDFAPVLTRSLAHVGAYAEERLIGFVNVAWDGGVHAFILDTCVHPDFRRQGIGVRLVREAARLARGRGAHWLHVDFEAHLEKFYRECGFEPTKAGLIRLRP